MSDSVSRMAAISTQIREAIRAALPMPDEQFMTVMVPGKVLNLKEYAHGFDPNTGKNTTPLLPTATELAQARLCDDMPTYGPFQMGPTGRSVARSYGAALSKMVPSGTTVGIDTEDTVLTNSQERYQHAMTWLTTLDPRLNQTRVETYTQKQHTYTQTVEQKTRAFADALEKAKKAVANPNDNDAIRAIYDQWVNENARTYRNFTQAAYMDWVITGKKEEVEYYFAIVDQDSAMARVEQSKEAMRGLVIQDSDGVVEYQKVALEPSCWAVYALNKMKDPTDNIRTAEWYTQQITRLRSMNALIDALKEDNTTESLNDAGKAAEESNVELRKKTEANHNSLKDSLKEVLQASKRHEDISHKKESTDAAKETAYNEYVGKKNAIKTQVNQNQEGETRSLSGVALGAQTAMRKGLIDNGVLKKRQTENDMLIKEYEARRQDLMQKGSDGGMIDAVARDVGLAAPVSDPGQGPAGQTYSARPPADYFTQISLDVSSSASSESSSASSSASSVKTSVGWWWSSEISVQHSSSQSSVERTMSNTSCKISFECMRVDITRPWMRPELFYDADLTVPVGQFISPGHFDLKRLMEGKVSEEQYKDEMKLYSTFPMYPTAFLLACNIVLEMSGETSSIQNHFSTSSTAVQGSLNYGPFSVSGDHSSSNTSASAKCEATATGCRITIKSPQIIGWISQIVPPLPRLSPERKKAIVAQQEAIRKEQEQEELDRQAKAAEARKTGGS